MSKPFPCRLIVDPPQDGAWNMAVDEALLDEAATAGIPSLRFYEWQEPTLSLGYFQHYADRQRHPASLSATVVRRQSGGGAILHDRELTYSISLPQAHPFAKNAQLLYDSVHQTLATELRKHISNFHQVRLVAENVTLGDEEPFLCFQRRALGDIILSSMIATSHRIIAHKIVGSAQRRSHGAVLQHGSLLLESSPLSPELLGLNDLCGTTLTAAELTDELGPKLAQALAVSCLTKEVSQNIRAQAESWYNDKYGNARWTTRR